MRCKNTEYELVVKKRVVGCYKSDRAAMAAARRMRRRLGKKALTVQVFGPMFT